MVVGGSGVPRDFKVSGVLETTSERVDFLRQREGLWGRGDTGTPTETHGTVDVTDRKVGRVQGGVQDGVGVRTKGTERDLVGTSSTVGDYDGL